MAEEAVLRIKLEEGTAGGPQPTSVPGRGATPGQPGQTPPPRPPEAAGKGAHDAIFDILRRVLGGGLAGSITGLVQSILGLFNRAGTGKTRPPTQAGAAPVIPPAPTGPQAVSRLRAVIQQANLTVARMLVSSAQTAIQSQQTAIHAPGAHVRITGVRMQQPPSGGRGVAPSTGPTPPAPRTPQPPQPPGGNPPPPVPYGGPGGRFPPPVPYGGPGGRFPPPAPPTTGLPAPGGGGPLAPRPRYSAPGAAGRPVFTYPYRPPGPAPTNIPATPYVLPAGGAPPRPPRPPNPPTPPSAPGGGGAGLGSALGAAAGVAGVVAAVVGVTEAVGHALGGLVDDISALAATMTSANVDISEPLRAVGDKLTSAGDTMMKTGNIFGIALFAAGKAVNGFTQVLQNLSAQADRYAQGNPTIAVAEAMSEVRQVVGDIRRGQRLAPNMAAFVTARSRAEQQFEELKVAVTEQILPLATGILRFIEQALQKANESAVYFEAIKEGILTIITLMPIPGSDKLALAIRMAIVEGLRAAREEAKAFDELPTSILMNNPDPFDVFSGLPRR